MKHLFQPGVADEVKARLAHLRADSPRAWGKMAPAQMLAHCSRAMEMALGEYNPPRVLLGRLLGGIAKRSQIDRGEPMRRNSPTAPNLLVRDERDFETERRQLEAMIDRFVAGGPAACTRHPHTFFGPLTPEEWASLMYHHLDHHLRQFHA